MTEKLYYDDPYHFKFEAEVVEINTGDKTSGSQIILDRTAFYPEGGGQPADIGLIRDMQVIDVKKEHDTVVHICKGTPDFQSGDPVNCTVDWEHRFDYMQQHSGQHVISGTLFAHASINTLSVHMGEDYTTVEVDVTEVPQSTLELAEDKANQTIWQNLEIQSRWVLDAEAQSLHLRRAPKVSGKIRIVQIGDADRVACGGVHVFRTSEIGLVKSIGVESIRGHARLIWKIGGRAIEDYRAKTALCGNLVDTLSSPLDKVGVAVEELIERLSQEKRAAKESRQKYAEIIAEYLSMRQEPVITHSFHNEAKDFLRIVSRTLIDGTRPFCLVNIQGESLQWCIGLPESSPEIVAANGKELMNTLLPEINGKGGGKPPLWQGVGNRPDNVDEFLRRFEELVKSDKGKY